MSRLAPGASFRHFTVEATVGAGGMGEVYRVRHEKLGRIQALKILHSPDGTARLRLMKEARLQASLDHPNVVAVTDVLELDDELGVVMEFVDGPTLYSWISGYKPSLQQRLELFEGALAGVAAAHRRGLVHRDLKPPNILIAFYDGKPVPKVADFGIAKNLHSQASQASLTRRGQSMGTPRYMAPEQIDDAKDVDLRADIFSMGCVLYELVCDQPAFPHENPWAAMAAIREGRYTPPKELAPGLPEAVCRAIEGCLIPDRKARIPNCDALLTILRGGTPQEHGGQAPEGHPSAPTTTPPPAATTNDTLDFDFAAPAGKPAAEARGRPAPLETATFDDWTPQPDVEPRPTLAPATQAPAEPARISPAPQKTLAVIGTRSWHLPLLVVGVLVGGLGGWLAVRSMGGGPEEPATPARTEPAEATPTPAALEHAPAPEPAPPTPPAAVSEPAPVEQEPKQEPASAAPPRSQPAPGSAVPASEEPLPQAAAEPADETPPPAAEQAVSTGSFGSADEIPIFLSGEAGRFREGQPVPAGEYTIHALFTGTDYVVAGRVELQPGQVLTLRCKKSFRRCDPE
jgi:serine/threonine protein kinase